MTGEKENEMPRFSVDVCRTGYGFASIEVDAGSRDEAMMLALEEAGSHYFSERESEYSALGITELVESEGGEID